MTSMKDIRRLVWVVVVLSPTARAQGQEARFQAPPGFVVERVAGPPLVRYPLFATFDDQGRLLVAEGTGANLSADELRARKLGRITLLEDLDGDGVFDRSRIFADGLVFPQGILWHDGAVYTASHPSFWKLEDPQCLGIATKRSELVTGFNFNGNGCDIHGPFLGPDGRLYWTDGRHGYKIHTRDGQNLEGLAARIWRCRTDGSDLERLCGGGFDNPVEIAFTRNGEAIGTMDQGPGDCLLHYVEGGVYPMQHPCLKEFIVTGPLLGAVRQYSSVLPAALSGLARYRSQVFGADYQDRLFSMHYMLHKVVRHDLIRDGSTFRAVDSDFLTTIDHDIRLTDVLEDADGSLLVVDMGAWFTYGFPGNPLPKPKGFGAIYRVRRHDVPIETDPWGKTLALDSLSPSALIRLLDDRRPRVRDRALDRLVKLGDAALKDLEAAVRALKRFSADTRREAVWAACRIGTPAALRVARLALLDSDEDVRLAAIHAVGLWRDAEATDALDKLVEEGSLPVRRKAADALGRIGSRAAVPSLLNGIRKGTDLFLEHTIVYALIRIDDPSSTATALGDRDPRVQEAALRALDQMRDGGLTREQIIPLARADDPALKRTVLEVISHRTEWSDLAESLVRAWIERPNLPPLEQATLTDVLLTRGALPPLQGVLADAVRSPRTPRAIRARLLGLMGQIETGLVPESWIEALREALGDSDHTVRRAAIGVARIRNLTALDQPLLALSRQANQPTELRIAALECVAGRIETLDDAAFALLFDHLSDTTDPLLRLASARTLGASHLSEIQLLRLAERAANTSAIVLRLILPVFGKSTDSRLGLALVDALERSPSVTVLDPAALDRTLQGFPTVVHSRARGLMKKLAATQEAKAAAIERVTSELAGLSGHVDTGHELFLSQRLGCFGCHRAVGRGGTIGPDLSKIGQIRSRAELLESILFPDLTIAPEYRSVQVATRGGKVVTGLVVRDVPDGITLRTTDLAEVRVAREDVEEIAPTTSSLMPSGIEKLTTRQELNDLLEFLSSQR
jgi:putative heme-binding domain-containing protein